MKVVCAWCETEGKETLIVDNYQGKPFGRCNDLTVAKNGAIYFTDSANPAPPLSPATIAGSFPDG